MDNKKGKAAVRPNNKNNASAGATWKSFRQSGFCRLMYDKGVLYFVLAGLICFLFPMLGIAV